MTKLYRFTTQTTPLSISETRKVARSQEKKSFSEIQKYLDLRKTKISRSILPLQLSTYPTLSKKFAKKILSKTTLVPTEELKESSNTTHIVFKIKRLLFMDGGKNMCLLKMASIEEGLNAMAHLHDTDLGGR